MAKTSIVVDGGVTSIDHEALVAHKNPTSKQVVEVVVLRNHAKPHPKSGHARFVAHLL